MTLWGSDLLRDRAGMGQAAAAASLASVVGGMTFGRLAGAPFLSRYDPERVLISAFIVAGLGFGIAWFSTSAPIMLTGYVIAGTGIECGAQQHQRGRGEQQRERRRPASRPRAPAVGCRKTTWLP